MIQQCGTMVIRVPSRDPPCVSVADLTTLDWVLLAVAAVLVGVAKTAFAGVGAISVALFAAVLPARESTGAILPLLMAGDVLGVLAYRRDAHWATLLRLIVPIGVGILAGVVFVYYADDVVMRRTIGVILLVLIGAHLALQRWRPDAVGAGPAAAWGYGSMAGFSTMVANSAGPAMSLYLLAAKLDKQRFLGTIAWFFAFVNLSKLPFSIGLGLISPSSVVIDALLVPGVLVGGWFGYRLVKRVDQKTFDRIIVIATVLAAVNLVR